MSVFNHPTEWCREMNLMLAKGEINKENYLTDCANAVVYVQETTELNKKLKAEHDALSAELATVKAERDRLNLAVDRLADKAAIYCPRDECCDKFQSDGCKACMPCMREWALAELPGAKGGGNGPVA